MRFRQQESPFYISLLQSQFVARKNPMPRCELEICQRLLDFRQAIRLSRKAMADALGVHPRRLETYERGRVPLPYHFAAQFCRSFRINPTWLAEGTEIIYIEGRDIPDLRIESDIQPRALFSSVYHEIIKPALSKKPQVGDPIKNERQLGLDISFSMVDKSDVKQEFRSLSDLMDAIRERTKLRGQKAALARELEVSRQAVDQWLDGIAKPSAETTFALLNWVRQPAGQKIKCPPVRKHQRAETLDHERQIK
jgi:transcriptional regulator with XRE-family HTH domain